MPSPSYPLFDFLAALDSVRLVPYPLAYDGGWYAYIARHGYPSALPAPGHQSPLAFFPAYPLLVRGTVDVTGLAVAQAGLLVNLVLSAVAVAGVTLVASRVLPREAAVAVGVLWSVLPTAYLLSLDYSEALYVACAAFALLAVLDGRWWWAGLLTGVAAGTRPTGGAVAGCWARAVDAVTAATAVTVNALLERRVMSVPLGSGRAGCRAVGDALCAD